MGIEQKRSEKEENRSQMTLVCYIMLSMQLNSYIYILIIAYVFKRVQIHLGPLYDVICVKYYK